MRTSLGSPTSRGSKLRLKLTEKDFTPKPWKNLRGTTLELFKWPLEAKEEFLFRLSRADLTESGPFSVFPGVERALVLTEGEPIELSICGRRILLGLWEEISFSGDVPVSAKVNSPGKDFNLMLRRQAARGRIEIVQGTKKFYVDTDFFAVFTIDPLELLVIHDEPGTQLTFHHETKYLVIRIETL